MTDGNTYAINKYLDEREAWDELQEVTAELEQAEAVTERYRNAWLEAEARIEELEAKLKAKEKLMLDLAGDKIDLVSELAGVKGKLTKAVGFIEDLTGCEWPYCEDAKRVLAELSSVSCANTKGQDDE